MSRANLCCNPLGLDKHRSKLGYFQINNKWHQKFHVLEGLFVCKSCKTLMYRKKDTFKFTRPTINRASQEIEYEANNCEDLSDCEAEDPSYQIPEKSISVAKRSICDEQDDWVDELKKAISSQDNRRQKISLLTTIPDIKSWSIRKTAKTFGVTRWMVKKAKNLREICGYGSFPDAKIGNSIPNKVLEVVNNFYLSDDVSRVMPGMKDIKSFRKNGGERQRVSVRTFLNLSYIASTIDTVK